MTDQKPKEVKAPVVEAQPVADEKPAEVKAEPKRKGPPVIKNNYTGPIAIKGVTIPAGESAPVPDFDPKQSVIPRWIEAGVIEVS